MLGFIQWTTPLMIAGLGLLALPLIAHILNRMARDRFIIPTIRFLQQSAAQQNKFLNLKRWLLLLLRCLAVALIVFAFARPVWWKGETAGNPTESVALAVVIDASLSTSRQVGNSTLFNNILAAAERSIDQLEPGRDVATVVVAKRTPSALVRKLSPNLPGLKNQLTHISGSYERADLEAAISEASRQLARHSGRKMLAIISDLQQSNWNEVLDQSKSNITIPEKTEINFVKLNIPVAGNISLSEATCSPADPIAGQPIQLAVRVTNYSDSIAQVPVKLLNGNSQLDEQTVQVNAQTSAFAVFEINYDPNAGGLFTFATNKDALTVDDRAYVSVGGGKQIPITVITDDPATELGTSTFFMERALRPFNNRSDRFTVQTLAVDQLDDQSLSSSKLVIIGYVGEWNKNAVNHLVDFLNRGGSALYLCGEGNVAEQLATIESTIRQEVFPFRLSKLERFDDFEKAPYIASGKWRSRWLKDYDFQSQVAIQQIRFPRVWAVGEVRNDAEILLSYSNDAPALGVKTFGQGQMILANLSPSIEFGEFGKFGSFAALIQIVARQMIEEIDQSRSILVGDSVVFDPEFTAGEDVDEFVVVGPEGSQVETIVSGSGDAQFFVVDRTMAPGFYELRKKNKTITTVAVSTDNRESDLRDFDPESIEDPLGTSRTAITMAESFSVDLLDKGQPFWGWLAMFGLIALAFESFLLGWWKR